MSPVNDLESGVGIFKNGRLSKVEHRLIRLDFCDIFCEQIILAVFSYPDFMIGCDLRFLIVNIILFDL